MLPVEKIEANTCAEGWIKSIKFIHYSGVKSYNHYEKEPSKEATVIINIKNPLLEPRLHPADLFGYQSIKKSTYIDEITNGSMDSYIETAWDYTYHDRIFAWGKHWDKYENSGKYFISLVKQKENKEDFDCNQDGFNQFEKLLEIMDTEEISRKLQMTTWIPSIDLDNKISSPCLQRIFFRILTDEKGEKNLIMNTHWRSRDLFRAWEANCYALCELGLIIAKKKGYHFVEYNDISDCLHIYFKDVQAIEDIFETMHNKLKSDPKYCPLGYTFSDIETKIRYCNHCEYWKQECTFLLI